MTKVLIIDDEDDLLELLNDFFDMAGFTVLQACDGAKAYAHLSANSDVRVIICDENLPDTNGHEILKKIIEMKASGALAKDTLLYFSSGSVELTDKSVKAEGADGLFTKPFAIDDMVNKVKSVVGMD